MLLEREQDLRVGGLAIDALPLRPRPAVAWLPAVEEIHASVLRPLPLLTDTVLLLVATVTTAHSAIGSVVAVAAFLAAGVVTGLYRHRTTIEAQGTLWYFRSVLVPLAIMAFALRTAANTYHLSLFRSVALAGGLLAVTRVVTWLVLARARRRQLGLQDALAVGPAEGVEKLRRRLSAFPEAGLRLASSWTPASAMNPGVNGHQTARRLLESGRIRHVLLASDGYDEAVLDECVRWSEGRGVDYSLVLPVATLAGTTPIRIGDLGVVPLGRIDLAPPRMWAKRAFDIVCSATLVTLLAPVFAVVALAIYLQDRGPVFYRQLRVGLRNRPFTMWKFRSMVAGADEQNGEHEQANVGSGLLFKLRDDPRITPVGVLVRRLSLDELPQLLNVLRGDMSLVGPRPLPVDPEAFDPVARKRHRVRPGITGSWQVAGANALGYDDMVKLDLAYIATWSFHRDVWLLLRTIPAVLVRRCPY